MVRRLDLEAFSILKLETGFNSIHYFSWLFKRTYGASPQQWRAERCCAAEELTD
ncbi:hypothetical protein [Paenibacillus ginsengarvi]|uniref:hypothetical protein n=1 Tax=Paenibacillus ginsengarvi TaxID=400777 RepID=UPI0013151303|nr:hypothetical protein [Paenibacillus ginsengarvi]